MAAGISVKMDGYHSVMNNRVGICNYLTSIKISRLILLVLVCLFTVSWIVHYSLPNSSDRDIDTHRSRKIDAITDDLGSLKTTDLKFRIEELRRIKASVNNELRELESKRQKLNSEISHYNTQIELLKNSYEKNTANLDQLRVSIENTKLEQVEVERKKAPLIVAPRRVLPSLEDSVYVPPPKTHNLCRMHNCFDYSRCPLTSGFPVYFYNADEYSFSKVQLDTFIKLSVVHAISATPYVTYDANIACLFIVLIGDVEGGLKNTSNLVENLQRLPYWHGDGRNHVLLNLARYHGNKDVFDGVDTGRAMIAQSSFVEGQLRPNFDVVISPSIGISYGDVWDQIPVLVPAHRKHLITFQGEFNILAQNMADVVTKPAEYGSQHAQNIAPAVPYNKASKDEQLKFKSGRTNSNDNHNNDGAVIMDRFLNRKLQSVAEMSDSKILLQQEMYIVDTLKKVQVDYPDYNFQFQFACDQERMEGVNGEWSICGPDSQRQDLLRESTFSLIIAPTNYSVITTTLTQMRLYESLKFGAIPIIVGDQVQLPYSELLTWRHVAIILPKARITELHYVIRSLGDADILELRRKGRIFWETYMGTTQSVVDTLLAVVRTRLGIPPSPIPETPSPSAFNGTFVPLKDDNPEPLPEAEQDLLGPIETPFPSPRFLRNYTFSLDAFNEPRHPFHLFPATPFEPVMPAEAKFIGSSFGYRPIGKGVGGAGKEFAEALGGNNPREQFTVVMLTYEREAVLLNAIARLKGLPYLNKVIVVWNSPRHPAEDLRWPEIGVPVHVVKTAKNSLNNRFLPFDAIETDAVLSIDDDAHLRHDEIMFGFRVWREARDRIVGFPGRFHAWDLDHNSWLYNSNYSCELSMVLTGAAFYHKYYSYLYSYVMAQAIRDKVDEFLNCEDLAMNFLISHITRKPPIKVTSRWTFRCPGCPQALSVDDEHFHERHKCMNFLVKVYGYMPLLNTQFRADSVLFKTRIPHDKQKCFKFI